MGGKMQKMVGVKTDVTEHGEGRTLHLTIPAGVASAFKVRKGAVRMDVISGSGTGLLKKGQVAFVVTEARWRSKVAL